MHQPLVRIATIIGMFSIIAAGVVTSVRATADPVERLTEREYGCESGDFHGAIIVRFAEVSTELTDFFDRIATIEYQISIEGGLRHEFHKTIPFRRDGNLADVSVDDQAAKGTPMSFGTNTGIQDGKPHPLGGGYYRAHAGGTFRFTFVFDIGGWTPDSEDCTVELSNLVPDRSESTMGFTTYSCEVHDFTGTIGISHEVQDVPDPTHVITKAEYKIGWKAGRGYPTSDRAKVRFEDSYLDAIQAFETDEATQDKGWHRIGQGWYDRGPATADSDTHEVTFEFTFDPGRLRIQPKCKVILPDLP